jgi:predicted ferric reductase
MESEWLRDGLRFALEASIFTTPADDGPGPPQQRDPRFRKLVEGVLYSRRLILTYHAVILGVITIVSAVHWTRKAAHRRRGRVPRLHLLDADGAYDGDAAKTTSPRLRAVNGEIEEASSSGSSTLEGVISPQLKDADEDTPLLQHDTMLQPSHHRRSIIRYFKAFLMYQPPPIPLFDKILPSNGTSIVLLAFIALNIFYTLFHLNLTIPELFVLADRCGLVFVANLPLLYIIGAKNQPLKFLTGYSYEFLNIFHRRLGELLFMEASLHGLGMFGVWYTLLGPDGITVGEFLTNRVVMLGLTALTAYQILYTTSLSSFRQKWYEVFLGLHVASQAAGLALVFLHHRGSRVYVGIAMAIFLIDRLVYRIGVKSTTVEAVASVLEDDETVKLSTEILKLPSSKFSRLVGRSIRYGWQASDHVFLSVPSLARKHIIQAHPFTIASAAPTSSTDQAQLDLLIRARDGFSSDLIAQARNQERLTVRLDGPYGSSHARTMLEDSELAILVAGGSGITVACPLMHHLLDITRSNDTEIAPISALRRQKIVLIWVVHKSSHILWVGRDALSDAENNGVEVITPEATEEVGRPDLDSMIDDLVKDYGKGKKIGVVACGPDSMSRSIRNTCSKLVWRGRDVNVAIEKFGW